MKHYLTKKSTEPMEEGIDLYGEICRHMYFYVSWKTRDYVTEEGSRSTASMNTHRIDIIKDHTENLFLSTYGTPRP